MNALSLDRRTILLLAIFPSLAIGLLNQFYLEAVYERGVMWFYLADAGQWIVAPALVWLFVLRPAHIKPHDYGLRMPAMGSPLFTLGLFLFVALLLLLSYLPVGKFAYILLWKYAGTFGYGDALPHSLPWKGLVIFYYAVTAAFVEEVVFRGLAWEYFSIAVPQPRREFWYITITALLFAATHSEQGPPGMIGALSYGIVAAALYANLKNLWPLVLGHFICDVISLA